MIAIGFDVYGTLVDPVAAMERAFGPRFGGRAAQAARDWRAKQVEYAFRRGLMRSAATFEDCAREALAWTAALHGVELDDAAAGELLQAYPRLPPLPQAAAALGALRARGVRMVAFSNGSPDAVDETLRHAGLRASLDGVVSVREVGSFKPDPAVYELLLARAGVPASRTWLVSANGWDVLGAKAAGLRAAWVRRGGSPPLDPWEETPDAIVGGLDELGQAIGLAPS
jgi:2-haloacid dehalogenase